MYRPVGYFYDACNSQLVVDYMASALHDAPLKILAQEIPQKIPLATPGSYLEVERCKFEGFLGQYEGSSRTADMLVSVVRPDHFESEARMVVEVGFSQSYDDLVQKAELWIEFTASVRSVLLINIEEEPNHSSPIKDVDLLELRMLNDIVLADRLNSPDVPEFGPVIIEGSTWVGEIRHAVVELWTRDENGAACFVSEIVRFLSFPYVFPPSPSLVFFPSPIHILGPLGLFLFSRPFFLLFFLYMSKIELILICFAELKLSRMS
jgi:hypothetical protein